MPNAMKECILELPAILNLYTTFIFVVSIIDDFVLIFMVDGAPDINARLVGVG